MPASSADRNDEDDKLIVGLRSDEALLLLNHPFPSFYADAWRVDQLHCRHGPPLVCYYYYDSH